MFDLDHPFFLPVWRRYAVVGLCVLWTLVELSGGAYVWAAVFGAAGLYCAKGLLLDFDEDAARAKAEADKRG